MIRSRVRLLSDRGGSASAVKINEGWGGGWARAGKNQENGLLLFAGRLAGREEWDAC